MQNQVSIVSFYCLLGRAPFDRLADWLLKCGRGVKNHQAKMSNDKVRLPEALLLQEYEFRSKSH